MRMTWQMQINAAARQYGMGYAKFISATKSSGMELNRKVLADLAVTEPGSFRAIVESAKLHRAEFMAKELR